jgi:mRNA interferase MazF
MMPTTPTRVSYQRGDVLLVKFPNSDLRSTKLRPALVIQASYLKTGLSQFIVAMITSRVERSGYPSRVLIQLASSEGRQSGLLSDSVVMTDNLATIATMEIGRKIGSIDMTLVDQALRYTLDLPMK